MGTTTKVKAREFNAPITVEYFIALLFKTTQYTKCICLKHYANEVV